MKLPDAWRRYQSMRDSHPALSDSPLREAAITRARFRKAQKMADMLKDGTPDGWPDDPEEFTPEQWAALMLTAGLDEASPATRVLTVELYRDRLLQREGLMDEDEAREFCTSNYSPAELFGR